MSFIFDDMEKKVKKIFAKLEKKEYKSYEPVIIFRCDAFITEDKLGKYCDELGLDHRMIFISLGNEVVLGIEAKDEYIEKASQLSKKILPFLNDCYIDYAQPGPRQPRLNPETNTMEF